MNGSSLNVTSNLYQLSISECWDCGYTGAGIKVGHLDTGVDASHPSLQGKIANFVAVGNDGDLILDALPQDSAIHGTHTAGIICGGEFDGHIIGVAPDATLCSGMVIEGGKPLLRVLSGLDWMFDQDVRVLCVSLGVPGYSRLFELILARLRQKGVLCVFPVGNSGRNVSHSPANYPGILAVGTVGRDNKVPEFSSSQVFDRVCEPVKPNLVAPGVDILAAQPGGGLCKESGTSMSAAHVTGVAALLFQAKPEATVDEVEHALLSTCIPLDNVDSYRYGSGLINPMGALESLLSPEK